MFLLFWVADLVSIASTWSNMVFSTEVGVPWMPAKADFALSRLLLPFKLALGGPIGNGRQWMPWIHIKDQIALIDFLVHENTAQGPYNACAPQPVRNADFAKTLGHVLRRPAFIPLPAFVLRTGLGELSQLLLGGQRAKPARLLAAGFTFQFTDLRAALDDLSARL